MTDKNDELNKKELADSHLEALNELNALKTNCLRGKDLGLDVTNLNIEAELAKYPGISATGYSIVVRLFTEAQQQEGKLIKTDRAHADQVFESFMGLVLLVSPDCYDPKLLDANGYPRFPNGPWCSVGEIITFPKSSGYYLYYNQPDGTTDPLFVITEAAPDVRIDPAYVDRIKRK